MALFIAGMLAILFSYLQDFVQYTAKHVGYSGAADTPCKPNDRNETVLLP